MKRFSTFVRCLSVVSACSLLFYCSRTVHWKPADTSPDNNACSPSNSNVSNHPDWIKLSSLAGRNTIVPGCLQVAWGTPTPTQSRTSLVQLKLDGQILPFSGQNSSFSIPLPADSQNKTFRMRLFVFPPDYKGEPSSYCQTTMSNVEYNCISEEQREHCFFYYEFRPTPSSNVKGTSIISNDSSLVCKVTFRPGDPQEPSLLENKEELTHEGRDASDTPEKEQPETLIQESKPEVIDSPPNPNQWLATGGGKDADFIAALARLPGGSLFVTGQIFKDIAQFGSQQTSAQDPEMLFAKLDSKGRWLAAASADSEGKGRSAGRAMSIDSNASAYIVGDFTGQMSVGQQQHKVNATSSTLPNTDIFVLKAEYSGDKPTWQWLASLGGPGIDRGTSINVGSKGDIIVAGILQRDPDGTDSRARTITYNSNQTLTINNDQVQFVGEIESNGRWKWIKTYADLTLPNPSQLKQLPELPHIAHGLGTPKLTRDGSDGIKVGGHFYSSNVKFGNFTRSSQGGSDLYILRLAPNTSRSIEWVRTAGSSGDDAIYDVYDNDTYLYAVGKCSGPLINDDGQNITDCSGSTGGPTIFVAILDKGKNPRWVEVQTGNSPNSVGYSITADSSGNAYITGTFEKQIKLGSLTYPSTPYQGKGIFIAKLNNKLEWQWVTGGGSNIRDTTANIGLAILHDPENFLFVAGSLEQTTTFPSLDTPSLHSQIDGFVIKLPKP